MLFGRGTTDCLGHVALITELLCQVRTKCGGLHIRLHVYIDVNINGSHGLNPAARIRTQNTHAHLIHVCIFMYNQHRPMKHPQLAERKVSLKRHLIVVFIANEVRAYHVHRMHICTLMHDCRSAGNAMVAGRPPRRPYARSHETSYNNHDHHHNKQTNRRTTPSPASAWTGSWPRARWSRSRTARSSGWVRCFMYTACVCACVRPSCVVFFLSVPRDGPADRSKHRREKSPALPCTSTHFPLTHMYPPMRVYHTLTVRWTAPTRSPASGPAG